LEVDSKDGIQEGIEDSGGLLKSAGVESNHEENLSVQRQGSKAYEAFGKGQEGKEVWTALTSNVV